jgi:hypothetical protein
VDGAKKMRKKQDGKQGQEEEEEDYSDTTALLYSLIPSFKSSIPTKGLIL